jgi:hypothetical protein
MNVKLVVTKSQFRFHNILLNTLCHASQKYHGGSNDLYSVVCHRFDSICRQGEGSDKMSHFYLKIPMTCTHPMSFYQLHLMGCSLCHFNNHYNSHISSPQNRDGTRTYYTLAIEASIINDEGYNPIIFAVF